MTAPLGRLVIVAYDWADGSPRLRIRPPEGSSEPIDAAGFSLRYRVDEPAIWHCPGRVPFRSGRGEYIDCLNRPQPDGRKCVDCAVAEATIAGSLHHAHLRNVDEIDAAVDTHLRQPNVLYLAGFGDGSIKVGTSTAERASKRLLEQGALMAIVVAEAVDGLIVRHVEDLITEKLGLPQSVTASRKLRGLVTPLPVDRLEAGIEVAGARVQRLLTDEAPPGVSPADESWANPDLHRILGRKLFSYSADLRRHSHHLTIEYMIGRLAVVSARSGDRFVVDVGRIFGLEIDSGDYEPVEITVQDSLF